MLREAKYAPIILFGGGAVLNREVVGRGLDVITDRVVTGEVVSGRVSVLTDVATDLVVLGVSGVVTTEGVVVIDAT